MWPGIGEGEADLDRIEAPLRFRLTPRGPGDEVGLAAACSGLERLSAQNSKL